MFCVFFKNNPFAGAMGYKFRGFRSVQRHDCAFCLEEARRPRVSSDTGGTSDEEKSLRILNEMQNVPDEKRSARFVCVLAMVDPEGEERVFEGICEGRITHELRGKGGFGYDPIFFYEEAGCTFAQMGREAKNRVSHRGRALRAFERYLRELEADNG